MSSLSVREQSGGSARRLRRPQIELAADLLEPGGRNRDERFSDHRVELGPGPAGDLIDRRRDGPLGAVRAIGGHGVEGVRHGHDARNERDGLALNPIGIALAVVTLVVVPDRLGFAREEPERLEDLVADHRMAPDYFELLLSELPRLAKDVVQHDELAQVYSTTSCVGMPITFAISPV